MSIVETGLRIGYLMTEIPGGLVNATWKGIAARYNEPFRRDLVNIMTDDARDRGDVDPWDRLAVRLFLERRDSLEIEAQVDTALVGHMNAREEEV